MSNKTPYVEVSASFYLKDAPRGQLGLRHESYTFGLKPLAFSFLAGGIIYQLLEFWIATMNTPAEELNAELQALAQAILCLKVEETSE